VSFEVSGALSGIGTEGLGSGFVASSVFEKASRSIDFRELGFEGGSFERIFVPSRIRVSDLGL
jgi:hypothetical protein